MTEPTRRTVLRSAGAAATLAAARAALPSGAHAQDAGPETAAAQLGFITLTDAAPLLVAKDRGLFAKYGMPDVDVVKQPSWAYLSDGLVLGPGGGGLDGAHILTSLAYLISLGKAEGVVAPVPLQILARLNTNGQGICVAKALMGSGARLDAAPFKAALAGKSETLVANTFTGGTHDLWLRYWLAAAGMNPEKDVTSLVVPPPHMVLEMRARAMAACCVGEPWPAQIVRRGFGYTACVTGEIWRDHPEKSLAMRAEWVDRNPRAAVALTAAVIEAQQWADRVENNAELTQLLAKPSRLGPAAADAGPRLAGNVDYGDGRKAQDLPVRMKFWADHASYPYQSHELWFLTECIRWGVLPHRTDTRAAIAAMNREDLWRLAAAKAGVAVADIPGGTSRGKETFFDGQVFDPAAPSAYLDALKVKKIVA